MISEKEALISTSDEVASLSNGNQVISISYLHSEDLGRLTETEEEIDEGGARVEIAMSKSVRITEPISTQKGEGEGECDYYTVEDAIDHMGFGPFQILVTLFAGMVWVRPYIT